MKKTCATAVVVMLLLGTGTALAATSAAPAPGAPEVAPAALPAGDAPALLRRAVDLLERIWRTMAGLAESSQDVDRREQRTVRSVLIAPPGTQNVGGQE